MRQILFTLCLSVLLLTPVIAQEETPEPSISDVIGMTVPQAEAFLNRLNYRLNPILLADFNSEAPSNTVIDHEIVLDSVTVTVAREATLELVWDITDYLDDAPFLGNLDGDELFTAINLSDDNIALRNIQIADFNASAWGSFLRARQCVQAWTFTENDGYRLPNCRDVQGGILNLTAVEQQFWRTQDEFSVTQNGIHRGTCQRSDGTCTLWVSPTPIAEDIVPYIYLVYDDEQWLVYNNDETNWMDISQVQINDLPNVADIRNWDNARIPDLDRLAPNQCVRFTVDTTLDSLLDCDHIALQQVSAETIFWTDPFTLTDTVNGNNTRQCPPSFGERTVCLFGR